MKKNFLFTSESVSEGHPDKVCDRISDMVVDSYLGAEPQSRVACETLTTTNRVVLAGEIRGPKVDKEDLILMDGDVFYDNKILKKLINTKKKNCLLIDKKFEKGDEPVKVCIKNNKIFDFGKIVNQDFDYQGESVGFFKFSNKSSLKLLHQSRKIMKSNKNLMYEEAIQEIIKEKKNSNRF